MTDATCSVEGCDKPTRSSGSNLCKMHYHRQYRHGDVNKTAARSGITVSAGRRYKNVYLPHHPLATKYGTVYAHRAVLYDKIGPGSHACHWCGKAVRWEATRGDDDLLTADHLNAIGDDNSPDNLVPSCVRCNNSRAAQSRHAALRSAGWWSAHDTIERLTTGGRKPTVVPYEVPRKTGAVFTMDPLF